MARRTRAQQVKDEDGNVVQRDLPLTTEEEAEEDAKDAAHLADAPNREREQKIEAEIGVLQKAEQAALRQKAIDALVARGAIS